ncbi:MAG: hypothetical protein K8J08_06105, partial [Thermoanaerobaculia bacterium]|nr:hypothetical protein [Thermoanaerobaculia bacterium]
MIRPTGWEFRALATSILWLATALGLLASEHRLEPGVDLQSVIESSAPGDVLRLAPGSYPGHYIVDRPLTIVGEASSEGWPILDGGGSGTVLQIKAPGVEIRGLVIRGSG